MLERMGASATVGALTDQDGLVAMFGGADVVCNFATHTPVGLVAAWPGSWKTNDRLRTELGFEPRFTIETALEDYFDRLGVRRP